MVTTAQTDAEERPPRSRLGRFAMSAVSLVVGLAIGAAAEQPLKQTFERVDWHREHGLSGTPDCRDPGWYEPIRPSQATAYRQYEQKGERPEIFTADNTLDGEADSAWIGIFEPRTGRPAISWTLPRDRKLTLICLRPGWTRDYGTLAGNLRPEEIVIRGCEEGEVTARIPDRVDLTARELTDDWRSYHSLHLDCTADEVELFVTAAHQANDRSQLLAISDVRFYTGFQWLDDD